VLYLIRTMVTTATMLEMVVAMSFVYKRETVLPHSRMILPLKMEFITPVAMDKKTMLTQQTVPALLYAVRHQHPLGANIAEICPELKAYFAEFATNAGRSANGSPTDAYRNAVVILNRHIDVLKKVAASHEKEVGELFQKHKKEVAQAARLDAAIKTAGGTPGDDLGPSLAEMAAGLSTSAMRWAASGFKIVDADTLEARQAVCRQCEFWDSQGFRGTGRCRKCGCSTQAKLRLASASCPVDKWVKVS
jgi:hypothetical protein